MYARLCRRLLRPSAQAALPGGGCQRTLVLRRYNASSTDAPSNEGVIARVRGAVRRNVSGYTRVLLVVMGVMCVVVVVAEQSIAANSVIVNDLPTTPPHPVYSYPLATFEPLSTPKQLYEARASVVNVVGGRGTGKTELLRQYANFFLADGPHRYYKLHKLSNRRHCNVFTVDARNSQTLGHSLACLCRKLRQERGVGGPSEAHNLLAGIKQGLLKQSRWLLIFENATEELELPELLAGCEEWGDGQVVITSETPLSPSLRTLPIASLIPRATAEKVYFSVAPPADVFDLQLLQDLFGGDLRAVVAAGKCVHSEQAKGIDFSFHHLHSLLKASTDPAADVKRLYCGLLGLDNPKMLFALDFIGKLPSDIPIPYKYIRQHMRTTMYDECYEPLHNYSRHRVDVAPQRDLPAATEAPASTPRPAELSFFARKRRDYCIKLGLDPEREVMVQLKELREQMSRVPTPPDDPELVMLKECPLLQHTAEYGGHVEAFTIDPHTAQVLSSLHTDFTAHLLEAALVLEQEQKFRRTWLAKIWSFNRQEKTVKARTDILGKGKVHPPDAEQGKKEEVAEVPTIFNSLLIYRANPISIRNMSEYQDLHYKQVLRSVMAFVDVSIPNSVRGTLETILLHGHLSTLTPHLPQPFSGLSESCALHLQAELGGDDLEPEFQRVLADARATDPRGPFLASCLHRFGVWLHLQDRDSEARVLLEEALQFADSLTLHRTMAQVCSELGEHATAEKHLEQAVNSVKPGDEDLLGPLLTDLGQVLLLQGKTAMGIKYLQGAIDGYKSRVGTENPEYARALNVVSIGHLMLGDALRANRARGEAGNVMSKLKKKRLVVEGGGV